VVPYCKLYPTRPESQVHCHNEKPQEKAVASKQPFLVDNYCFRKR
jgi:uncharacterized protein YqcC (DUF446 family)